MSVHKKFWENGNIRYIKEVRHQREKHYYYDSQQRLRCIFQTVNQSKCGPFKKMNQFGETIENSYYLNNQLHGKSLKYRSNGNLFQEATYYKGKLHGYIRNYNYKGRLQMETNYEMGLRHGFHIVFSPQTGEIVKKLYYEADKRNGYFYLLRQKYMLEGSFKNNKRDGLWIKFFFRNGKNTGQETFHFSEGKKHGLWTLQKNFVHDNFNKESTKFYSIGLYFHDQKHGPWKFYTNSQLIKQRSYLLGKLNGISLNYCANKQRYEVIPYLNDKIHGCLQIIENKNIISVTQYEHGKRQGNSETFFANGVKKSQSSYHDDKLEGQTWNYNENGILISTYHYKNNQLHGAFWKMMNGLHCYGIFDCGRQADFEWKIYPHGVAYQFTSYKNGKIHGNQYTFAEDGTLSSFQQYYNGKKHHRTYTYFSNGEIKTICPYYHGKINGCMQQFFKNGNLSFKMYCYENKLDGPFEQFSSTGHLLKKGFFKQNKLQGWAKINDIYGVFHDSKAIVLSSKSSNECVICYEKTQSKTHCNHHICFSCTKKLLVQPGSRKNCPYCRVPFPSKEILSVK